MRGIKESPITLYLVLRVKCFLSQVRVIDNGLTAYLRLGESIAYLVGVRNSLP